MKQFRHLPLLLVLMLSQAGCQTASAPDVREADRNAIKEELEISLKADRERLADLRKEIPADRQSSNDELALYLNLMKDGSEKPAQVQSKFNSLVQKRRSSFRTKAQRLREDYRKEETRRREDFLSGLKARRDEFTRAKRPIKENREFFAEQDKQRQRFFADERDRRQSFESEIHAQSKDFESYMRERQNEFNELFRQYSNQFHERAKEKRPAASDPATAFERLKSMEAQPLSTDN